MGTFCLQVSSVGDCGHVESAGGGWGLRRWRVCWQVDPKVLVGRIRVTKVDSGHKSYKLGIKESRKWL